MRQIWYIQWILWCIASAISFMVVFGLTVFGHEVARLGEEVSLAIAITVGMVINFLVQRYAVFGATSVPITRQFPAFLVNTLGFRGTEYLLFCLFHTWLGFHYQMVLLSIQLIGFVLKFVVSRMVIFAVDSEPNS